jgi:hypothetical protein
MSEPIASNSARLKGAGYGTDPDSGDIRFWFQLITNGKRRTYDFPAEDVARLGVMIDQYMAEIGKDA